MQLAPLALGARHDLARVQARAAPVDVHLTHGSLGAVLGGGAGLVRLATGVQIVGVAAVILEVNKQYIKVNEQLTRILTCARRCRCSSCCGCR